MKNSKVTLVVLATLLSGTALFAAQRHGTAGQGTRATVRPAVPNGTFPEGSGTISYDNNTPFARNGADGGTVGNLFNTAPDPHGVASASFRMAGNYVSASATTGSIVMTIWDQEPASFMLLSRVNVTNAPGVPYGGSANITMFTVMVPLAAPIAAHNGGFVGGLHNTEYGGCAGNVALNSTCDGVALTMGGVDPGMGFHGFRVPFATANFVPTATTVAGTGTSLGNVNAIFRVTGDNLPVELMSFGIE
jgi:hypothetical protein